MFQSLRFKIILIVIFEPIMGLNFGYSNLLRRMKFWFCTEVYIFGFYKGFVILYCGHRNEVENSLESYRIPHCILLV